MLALLARPCRWLSALVVPAKRTLAALLGVAPVLGCGDALEQSEVACVESVDRECRPLYAPATFQVIFDRIVHPTCARGMGTCHTADARMAGLVFEDEAEAYALLLGESGSARVLPGDPECSLLVKRLASDDPRYRMPPGPTPLLDSELCTITQWIAEGAQR